MTSLFLIHIAITFVMAPVDDLLSYTDVLLEGLLKLYNDVSSKMSTTHNRSISDEEIYDAAVELAAYLEHFSIKARAGK